MISSGDLLSYDKRCDVGTDHRYALSDKYIWYELSDGSIICTDTSCDNGRNGNILWVYRDGKVCFVGEVFDIDGSTLVHVVDDNIIRMEYFNSRERVSIDYSLDVSKDYLQYLQYRYLILELRKFLKLISTVNKISAFDIMVSRSEKCIYVYGQYKQETILNNSKRIVTTASAKQAIKFQDDIWTLLPSVKGRGIEDLVASSDIVIPQVLDYLNTTRFRLVDEDAKYYYISDISDGTVERIARNEYYKVTQAGVRVVTEWNFNPWWHRKSISI